MTDGRHNEFSSVEQVDGSEARTLFSLLRHDYGMNNHSYRRCSLLHPRNILLLIIANSFSPVLATRSCVSTFFQTFVVNQRRIFDDDDVLSFQLIMEDFTDSIAGSLDANNILTKCTVLNQFINAPDDTQHSLNQIEYSLSWSSDTVDVTLYGKEFRDIIDNDGEALANILQNGGLSVSEANRIFLIGETQCSSTSPAEDTTNELSVDTDQPTALPTFSVQIESKGFFYQNYTVSNDRIFSENDIMSFKRIMEGYTANFSNSEFLIESSCELLFQSFIEAESKVSVGYTMSWASVQFNVSAFPVGFETFMNRNFGWVAKRLEKFGLSVVDAGLVFRYDNSFPSWIPYTQISISPSAIPSKSLSFTPYILPSYFPSTEPTSYPSSQSSKVMSSMPNVPTPVQMVITDMSSASPNSYVIVWMIYSMALWYIS